MDLSKAFDSLHRDILIAKLHAYGFEMKAIKLIYSYLINKTQTVKVKGEYSARRQFKAGVPQGSLLGVLLFNVYLNDMFDSVQTDLYNFADDNNLSTLVNTINEAGAILITETDAEINWIESNQVIRGISLKSEANFMLLGVDIDNRLSFHGHINNLCRKAANPLNALKRLCSFMGMTGKTILMKSFILSNFNNFPLVWHFCSKKDTDKMDKIQKELLE